ncbi:2-dehydro-3-deoxyphosphogluconate aldolase [Paramixta manurensis]|uniref:2-dehydro-3-deoxy-phosphogluconate aldolase n=1 Tax=Paramixta manurensis TaxID=2740817 RepID=A0A6M8U4K1_9GAMM|nr:2-dehydro-3-deoxyphosphogluconate aldolase [Erwiniaceae bacterium PD-1]
MHNPFITIEQLGVIPEIAIDNAQDAIPLADALLEGGLPLAEVTFRTPDAAQAIALMRQQRPELLVGAGTLLDAASVEIAQRSGAAFGLAPGIDAQVLAAAQQQGMPFAPGIMTPSDLSLATHYPVQVAKFFPAGLAGGPAALQGIYAPFAHLGLRFIPTGGISENTLADWLRLPIVLAVGGSWIARSEDIRQGNFSQITRNAKAARAIVQQVREASTC